MKLRCPCLSTLRTYVAASSPELSLKITMTRSSPFKLKRALRSRTDGTMCASDSSRFTAFTIAVTARASVSKGPHEQLPTTARTSVRRKTGTSLVTMTIYCTIFGTWCECMQPDKCCLIGVRVILTLLLAAEYTQAKDRRFTQDFQHLYRIYSVTYLHV